MQGPNGARVRSEIAKMSPAAQRFLKEGALDEGVAAWPEPEGQTKLLHGVIAGPTDSPYEGGSFHVRIEITDTYPFGAPKVKFTTPIWHPNISSRTGTICLDVLGRNWSPALNLTMLLKSVQSLMTDPAADDALDGVAGQQYRTNRSAFNIKAKQWTAEHASSTRTASAKAPATEPSADALRMVEMGVNLGRAEELLAAHGGLEAAVAAHFGGL